MLRRFVLAALPFSLLLSGTGAAFAQSVISARSGLVHYVEGQVTLDDKAVDVKYSQFPEVRTDQVLKTEEGRAEVLLTPGVFLRLSENSGFRMLSNKLTDTRVEALSGSVIVEHGEVAKDNQVTLIYKDRTISFLKSGLYRLDAENGSLRVYQGEARVVTPEQSIVAKQSHEIELNAAAMASSKFDAKADDEFYRWASRRAGYLSMANVSAAKSLHDSGYSMTSSMWSWNPWYGMFTFVPMNSMYYSPFGYSFYNPYMVSQFYFPRYGYYSGYSGYGGGGGTVTRAASASPNYSIPARPASNMASVGNGGARSFGGGGGASSGMSAGSGIAGPSSRGMSGGGMSGGGVSGGTSSAISGGGGRSAGGGGGGSSSGGRGR
jgi:hypothetical protein